MNGRVDESGRALIEIPIRAARTGLTTIRAVWIDTGFTGELVLPHPIVESLNLGLTSTTAAVLADGSEVSLATYECYVEWFGKLLRLQALANNGKNALLGVGLLRNRDLHINYQSRLITID